MATNSWRLWTRGADIYVACRDNFKEIKVSLHASGVWRLAYTQEALKARPELVPADEDRVWQRWVPPENADSVCVVAFRIVFPPGAVYVDRRQRRVRPPEVLIEYPSDSSRMIVANVCVVPSQNAVTNKQDLAGGVVGILPLAGNRSVQLVATYEDGAEVSALMKRHFDASVARSGEQLALNDGMVFFMQGMCGQHAAYVAADSVLNLRRAEQAFRADGQKRWHEVRRKAAAQTHTLGCKREMRCRRKPKHGF